MHIGLAVLHTVRTRLIASSELQLVIAISQVAKDLSDDVGHGLVLKNPTIGGTRQVPEPRDEHRLVAIEPVLHIPLVHATLEELAYTAMDVARPILCLQVDGGGFAQQGAKRNRGIIRQ